MATKKSTPTKRRYSSQLRQQHALQTREQVLAAAAELFEESGWAGTTVAAIATRAGVAVETIYSGFGSKKQVLRAVVDFAVVGDAEPVPLVDREVFSALAIGDFDGRVVAGVEMLADIHARLAKLWRTVGEAAASDDEIEGWRLQWEEGRRVDVRRSVELITQRGIDDVLLDLFWGIFSHEVYGMLVLDRGLDRAQYAERMRTAVTALVPEE
ncbi:MAG TPA: helix-turn-helix domain-containing protein [Acidimicrobiia bacterium]|jgi:AcrR family transcriptional regulator